MGTVVHFESGVPTEWEKTHLPVILITSKVWNPTEEGVLCPEKHSCESIKVQTIQSLTSGITKRQIKSTKRDGAQTQIEQYGEIEIELTSVGFQALTTPRNFAMG
jgi:hypothetical protein